MAARLEEAMGLVIGLAVSGAIAFVGLSLVLSPVLVPLWFLALR